MHMCSPKTQFKTGSQMMRTDLVALAAVLVHATLLIRSQAQLSSTFYDTSCPNASTVVRSVIVEAKKRDVRAGGKLMRIHFHDCFVNGCDGSVLLDNADGIESEKDAALNAVSLEGWNTVDDIKTALEYVCPGVVSCADILAIASEAAVSLAGGRDGLTVNRSGADMKLPGPRNPLDDIKQKFSNVGDLTLLI